MLFSFFKPNYLRILQVSDLLFYIVLTFMDIGQNSHLCSTEISTIFILDSLLFEMGEIFFFFILNILGKQRAIHWEECGKWEQRGRVLTSWGNVGENRTFWIWKENCRRKRRPVISRMKESRGWLWESYWI